MAACEAAAAREQGDERRRGAAVLDARQGVSDGPPVRPRLTGLVERQRRQRVVRLHPRERIERQPPRFDLGRLRVGQVVGIDRRHGRRAETLAGLRRNRGRGGRVTQQAQRFGGTAQDQRGGVAERRPQRLDGAVLIQQAQRKGGHLPDLGLAVRREQSGERRHAFRQADAAHRQCRAPAHARFGVGEQAQQVRRG